VTDLLTRLRLALADRYAIERELGRGGMATFYLAQDLKHHRQVAVKVLKPEVSVALGAERFLREIKIAAQLNHPHILALHDSGETDDFLYYVMPYVEGESLRARLEDAERLPAEEAGRITREVAEALDYAHRRGVLHRDIKPENILLADRQAVVADFGIARAVQTVDGERLTGTGLFVGTPGYMSPEQATGQQLDGRTDVYSLGCVLYEMLTRQPRFPPSTMQLALVPEALKAIVRTATAAAAADRFATAQALADALPRGGAISVAHRPRVWLVLAGLGLAAGAAASWWIRPWVPSATPALVAQRSWIEGAIVRYGRAIEARDLDAVQDIAPGLGSEQMANFRQFFKDVRDIRVGLRVTRLEGTGQTAQADVSGTIEYVQHGEGVSQPMSFQATLAHDRDGWRVTALQDKRGALGMEYTLLVLSCVSFGLHLVLLDRLQRFRVRPAKGSWRIGLWHTFYRQENYAPQGRTLLRWVVWLLGATVVFALSLGPVRVGILR
jgi:hypothetical protein